MSSDPPCVYGFYDDDEDERAERSPVCSLVGKSENGGRGFINHHFPQVFERLGAWSCCWVFLLMWKEREVEGGVGRGEGGELKCYAGDGFGSL